MIFFLESCLRIKVLENDIIGSFVFNYNVLNVLDRINWKRVVPLWKICFHKKNHALFISVFVSYPLYIINYMILNPTFCDEILKKKNSKCNLQFFFNQSTFNLKTLVFIHVYYCIIKAYLLLLHFNKKYLQCWSITKAFDQFIEFIRSLMTLDFFDWTVRNCWLPLLPCPPCCIALWIYCHCKGPLKSQLVFLVAEILLK